MQRDLSPSRQPFRGRSVSPERREYDAKGGGRSSSRQRSPTYYVRHGDRPRDNGYSDRKQKRRGGDEGYGEREREKEREAERSRYEGSARRDRPKREGDDEVGLGLQS